MAETEVENKVESVVAETTPVSYINDKGDLLPGWNKVLPVEMQELPVVKQAKNMNGLISQVVNLEKQHGQAIFLPKDDDPEAPAKWAKLQERLNVPNSPFSTPKTIDEYKLEDVKLPEGFNVHPDLKKTFLESALKNGTNGKAVAGIYKDFMAAQGKIAEEINTALKKDFDEKQSALDKDWGDKKTENLQRVEDAKNSLLEKDFIKLMDDLGYTNHPVVMNQIFKLGQRVGNDTIVKGNPGSSNTGAVKPMLENQPDVYFKLPDSDPKKAGYVQWFHEQGYDEKTNKWKK